MQGVIHSDRSNSARRERVLAHIAQSRHVTVDDLMREFPVSAPTIRRDLEYLAESGKIQRVHGGAIAIEQLPIEPPILQRQIQQTDEKSNVGRAAAALVQNGEAIYLGSGSTVWQMALHLREHKNITVVTNSLPVINALVPHTDITVICLGGVLRHSERSFIGYMAEQALDSVRVAKIFIGTRGIDLEQGLTGDFVEETAMDRAVSQLPGDLIVLADHTKCGQIAPALIAPISKMKAWVTDQSAPTDFRAAVEEKGVNVIVA